LMAINGDRFKKGDKKGPDTLSEHVSGPCFVVSI